MASVPHPNLLHELDEQSKDGGRASSDFTFVFFFSPSRLSKVCEGECHALAEATCFFFFLGF